MIESHDPLDPPDIKTYTVCEACNGTGEEQTGFQYIDVTKTLYVILLVPNFLIFWS